MKERWSIGFLIPQELQLGIKTPPVRYCGVFLSAFSPPFNKKFHQIPSPLLVPSDSSAVGHCKDRIRWTSATFCSVAIDLHHHRAQPAWWVVGLLDIFSEANSQKESKMYVYIIYYNMLNFLVIWTFCTSSFNPKKMEITNLQNITKPRQVVRTWDQALLLELGNDSLPKALHVAAQMLETTKPFVVVSF